MQLNIYAYIYATKVISFSHQTFELMKLHKRFSKTSGLFNIVILYVIIEISNMTGINYAPFMLECVLRIYVHTLENYRASLS
jgi:hypothetical protein